MRFQTYQITDPGGRDPNEDSVGSFSNGQFCGWIAADGLGGHLAGELASAEAVKSLEKSMKRCESLDMAFIRDAFRDMNNAVLALEGPLTTAVCAVSDGKKLFYGNDGDSRFIFLRNRKILFRTNDHSLAFLAYMNGDISYENIPQHPAQNRLYHSVGNEIDFFGEFYEEIELEAGDAFMLCTDGFWELVTDNEIERSLQISQTTEEWLNTMLEELRARLKPSSDNYSAVCVIVRED